MLYRFDSFEVDTDRFELRRDGAPVPAEPLVFDLICFLLRNPGRVIGRDEIIAGVWHGRIVSDATIASCVKSARKALGDSGDAQNYIRTVRGRGFQFLGVVETGTGDAPSSGAEGPAGDAAPAAVAAVPMPGPEAAGGVAPAARPRERPVLAVLPFQNLSAEMDEYFADGLTEDIITNLTRFRDLMVIGRSSTFQFKGQGVPVQEICARLNADHAVEGSVRRAGGRVRINAKLVDPSTGVQEWADHYDRDMEDIFAVQDEVTRTIAATLGATVQDVATRRALKKSASELDAYDCVLRARRYTALLSEDVHAEARDLLEQAVARDPNSAEAHALLANVYLAEHRFDANPRPDPIGRALTTAQQATRLDPQNAYARCWLGIVHFFRRENDSFRAEAERALALNPNDPETLADIGHYLAFMGEFERGVALSRRAMRLNPLHPGWYHFSAARDHYDRREYAAVLADLERIGLPHFYWTHMLRAAALGQLGRMDEARDAVARLFALRPGYSARAELTKWNAAEHDSAHILDGLRKAGLAE